MTPAPSSLPGKIRFRWGPEERITRDTSIYTRAMLCGGGVLACAGVALADPPSAGIGSGGPTITPSGRAIAAGPAIGGAPGGPRGVDAPMHKVSNGSIVSRGRDDRALDRLGS